MGHYYGHYVRVSAQSMKRQSDMVCGFNRLDPYKKMKEKTTLYFVQHKHTCAYAYMYYERNVRPPRRQSAPEVDANDQRVCVLRTRRRVKFTKLYNVSAAVPLPCAQGLLSPLYFIGIY